MSQYCERPAPAVIQARGPNGRVMVAWLMFDGSTMCGEIDRTDDPDGPQVDALMRGCLPVIRVDGTPCDLHPDLTPWRPAGHDDVRAALSYYGVKW